MGAHFDHEKLDVYQEAILFASWADEFLCSIPRNVAAKDQLDRASTSIALNIAEGNGKFAPKDRCRFLSNAYGSAVECAACLDVFVAKELAKPEDIQHGKDSLRRIVSMLVKLRSSIADRVGEEGEVEYQTERDRR